MSDANHKESENDPIRLWQNQPQEESKMTLKLIRQRAQDLDARTRRELLGNLIVAVPITVGIAWFGYLHTHATALRIIFVAAAVWAALGQYFVHRGMWRATPPERSAMMTSLEFYRRAIKRRRNLLARLLQWNFAPIFLSLGALVVLLTGIAQSMGKLRASLPFTILAVIWIVAVFVLRSRHQQELKREIEQLNEIETVK